MIRLLRIVFSLALLVCFVWFGMTVKLGNHTLFGHFERIWKAEETQDLVEGTKEAAEPIVDRTKRAVESAVEAAASEP